MKKENQKNPECCPEISKHKENYNCHSGQSNAIYGLGVVGALFYFLSTATNFSSVILGIGKSIFWPAILIFELLTYLQM